MKTNLPAARADLAVMAYQPVGFIGTRLFPAYPVRQKAGTVYYAAAASIDSAQSGRTAGGAVSGINVTSASDTFATVEKLARIQADAAEIALLGGEQAAEKKLAMRGHKSVAKAIEVAVVAVCGFSTATDIHADIAAGLKTKIKAVRNAALGQAGKVVIAGGSSALDLLRANEDIKDAMLHTGVTIIGADARLIGNTCLSEILGVNEVIEGLDGIWPVDKVVVAFIPDPNTDPTVDAQLGRTVKYQFDDQGTEISCEEGYDPATRSPYLDFVSNVAVKTFNATFISAAALVAPAG